VTGRASLVQMGDVAAIEDLYRRQYRRFLRVAIAVVGSPDAAADAVQEAFARALRERHSLRTDDALPAWIWRMVMNAAIDQQRRTKREVSAAAPETAVEPDELVDLRDAVAALPDRQRHTLFLRHYADLSYDEIAEVLGVARGTVAAALHAAHETLRAEAVA
jgi:RNA polymerase sigma-70 factor, ECF subfamily